MPSIKELYSLIDFNGLTGMNAVESVPFIDTTYFEFRYGNEAIGERFIDAQYISATDYVGTTMNGDSTVFGVNFADGRIKGYGITVPNGSEKLFEVRFVRGDTTYGINQFVDNGDGTINDNATGLMWSHNDCGVIQETLNAITASDNVITPYGKYLASQPLNYTVGFWTESGQDLFVELTGGTLKVDNILPPTDIDDQLIWEFKEACNGDITDPMAVQAAMLVRARSDYEYMVPIYGEKKISQCPCSRSRA